MERETRTPSDRPANSTKKRKSKLPQILLILSVVTVAQLASIILLIIISNNKIDKTVRGALDTYFAEQEDKRQDYDDAQILESLTEPDLNTKETAESNDEPAAAADETSDEPMNEAEPQTDDTEDIDLPDESVLSTPQADMPPLFNRNNPIPDDYLLELVSIGGGFQLQAKAAQPFFDMRQAAENDGIYLSILSAYRSNERQTINFNNSVNQRMANGMVYEAAFADTARYIAVPGTSEHEAGLALDLNMIDERFDQTLEYKWLVENSTDYGFILRYEKETEHITGIAYEPWHYRYVGTEHAKIIAERGITLDEYVSN